ncbi:hypothetical protein OE88DRAFT_1655295 [Heliocybe sulcata]|uniref:Uncharacterized protein n=1 Tax=Heliocybe sulcata TaxID=5364 RepID=A0A5C3NB32_9AGAM|nr:hypothetical protein OE88DRAFT_1655295 [Heliocybe sulcata]
MFLKNYRGQYKHHDKFESPIRPSDAIAEGLSPAEAKGIIRSSAVRARIVATTTPSQRRRVSRCTGDMRCKDLICLFWYSHCVQHYSTACLNNKPCEGATLLLPVLYRSNNCLPARYVGCNMHMRPEFCERRQRGSQQEGRAGFAPALEVNNYLERSCALSIEQLPGVN